MDDLLFKKVESTIEYVFSMHKQKIEEVLARINILWQGEKLTFERVQEKLKELARKIRTERPTLEGHDILENLCRKAPDELFEEGGLDMRDVTSHGEGRNLGVELGDLLEELLFPLREYVESLMREATEQIFLREREEKPQNQVQFDPTKKRRK